MSVSLYAKVFRSFIQGTLIGALMLVTGSAQANADKKIERLWKSKCGSCHGAEGKGDTEQGKKMAVDSMASATWQKAHTDDQIKQTIANGVKREKKGVKQEMDPYKDELKPEQVDGLVKFIRSLGRH